MFCITPCLVLYMCLSLYLGILNGLVVVVAVVIVLPQFLCEPPPFPLSLSSSVFFCLSWSCSRPRATYSIKYHIFIILRTATRVWFLCSNYFFSCFRFCFCSSISIHCDSAHFLVACVRIGSDELQTVCAQFHVR